MPSRRDEATAIGVLSTATVKGSTRVSAIALPRISAPTGTSASGRRCEAGVSDHRQ